MVYLFQASWSAVGVNYFSRIRGKLRNSAEQRGGKSDVGWRVVCGGWRVAGEGSEVRGQRSEVRSWRSGVGGQRKNAESRIPLSFTTTHLPLGLSDLLLANISPARSSLVDRIARMRNLPSHSRNRLRFAQVKGGKLCGSRKNFASLTCFLLQLFVVLANNRVIRDS